MPSEKHDDAITLDDDQLRRLIQALTAEDAIGEEDPERTKLAAELLVGRALSGRLAAIERRFRWTLAIVVFVMAAAMAISTVVVVQAIHNVERTVRKSGKANAKKRKKAKAKQKAKQKAKRERGKKQRSPARYRADCQPDLSI